MHNNLFSEGHTQNEVYAGLIDHQDRDSKRVQRFAIIAVAGALLAVWSPAMFEGGERVTQTIGALIAFYGAAKWVRYFVDMSNRTFFLHAIDWQWETDRKRME
jgi:hypothetical protein